MPFKDKRFSAVFYFRYIFFYTYIYCKKVNAESNQLIKTVDHRARFFSEKNTHLCQQFGRFLDIFIFSLIKSLSCN